MTRDDEPSLNYKDMHIVRNLIELTLVLVPLNNTFYILLLRLANLFDFSDFQKEKNKEKDMWDQHQ